MSAEERETCGYCQLDIADACTHADLWATLRAREAERDEIAYRVEHPELAHLHYDGCPYKPWSDKPSWETPDDAPDCTCGEAAKGAYWKGQHLLERGYHDITRKERDALAATLAQAERRYENSQRTVAEVTKAFEAEEIANEELRATLAQVRGALSSLYDLHMMGHTRGICECPHMTSTRLALLATPGGDGT